MYRKLLSALAISSIFVLSPALSQVRDSNINWRKYLTPAILTAISVALDKLKGCPSELQAIEQMDGSTTTLTFLCQEDEASSTIIMKEINNKLQIQGIDDAG